MSALRRPQPAAAAPPPPPRPPSTPIVAVNDNIAPLEHLVRVLRSPAARDCAARAARGAGNLVVVVALVWMVCLVLGWPS